MKEFFHHIFEGANAKIAAAVGMVGGLLKYNFLQITQSLGFWESLGKAALTALVCGIAGVVGKEIYGFAKRKFLKSKGLKKSNEKNVLQNR